MDRFEDLPGVPTGDFGEQLVYAALRSDGWIVYPHEPGRHPFDMTLARLKDEEFRIGEVKTTFARDSWLDTGINHRSFLKYMAYKQCQVSVFFVDGGHERIYGGKLSDLVLPCRAYDWRSGYSHSYPWTQEGITYFPLVLMTSFWRISQDNVAKLREMRRSSYVPRAVPPRKNLPQQFGLFPEKD